MQTLERTTPIAIPDAPSPARPARFVPVGVLLRACIAAFMVGSAAIHFGMMGEHAGVSWTHGLFFATVGWLQLAFAACIIVRPTRAVAVLGLALNLAILGVWLLTRTVGIAIGGDGSTEAWGFVDGLCAAFEVAAIVATALWYTSPTRARHLSRGVGWGGVGVAIAAVIGLTAFAFSPAIAATDGRSHGTGGDGHGEAVDDKGLSALSNGHQAHIGAEQPLTAAERAALSAQIAVTIEVARQYPTVADALAAGYRRAGPYTPGLGAHFTLQNGQGLNFDGVMDDEDLRHPLAIIYDGVEPDSRIAGYMYYSFAKEQPQGFAGPNDQWHFHTVVCLKPTADGLDAPLGADREVTDAQCAAAGGSLLDQTQWMVHVWSVPGWESQQGLFGEVNPALACPDGTYYQRPIEEWVEHPLNSCESAA